MSSTQPVQTYRCSHCGGPRTKAGIEGSYCSRECYYRARGEKLISRLDSHHQLCSTCYGRVKTVEPIGKEQRTPAPEHANRTGGRKNVLDGFQYRTELTTWGVDEFSDDPHRRLEGTRWSCECGAVNPNDRHAAIQNVDLKTVFANFYRALEYLHDRDAIDHKPDRVRYFASLRENPRDAAYAAGRAVYA